MKTTWPRSAIPLLFLAVATSTIAAPRCVRTCRETYQTCRRGCAGLQGTDRHRCVVRCGDTSGCPPGGARIRTLAYVVTTCEEQHSQLTGKQELFVRRGDCDPVKVREYSYSRPVVDPFPLVDLCPLFGALRWGNTSPIVGVFQRLGVPPDGSRVVFETARNGSPVTPEPLPVPEDEQGIFSVSARADELPRRVGDVSREPSAFPGIPSVLTIPFFVFTPDGKTIVFPDRGPGPDGRDAVQIASLDITNGTRRTLTRLPFAKPPSAFGGVVFPPQAQGGPSCVNAATDQAVSFFTTVSPDADHPRATFFQIGLDGTGLRALELGGDAGERGFPAFQVIGHNRDLATFETDGTPKNRPSPIGGPLGAGNSPHPFELFIRLNHGSDFVQITHLGRSDTGQEGVTTDGRIIFHASANDTGPDTCQLFSVGPFGGPIRQLTHFTPSGTDAYGCYYGPPSFGCVIDLAEQDPVTKTIVFYSTCDPFGTNPNGGQLFAMRPDGSGLRQLTQARGVTGTSVQLPGPFAHAGGQSHCQ